ncbi:TetR/AcrR family transcriptional regulator [Actinomadura rifamycini]|uniref:TetR/AcrR family transcriptional regulator n=1 Tax=Actinomadura rifamycini TaxID=31962 RepID=UPI0004177556|nr:TetR/AcrR family transcriptional regulator [Actinomadura rifamycini]
MSETVDTRGTRAKLIDVAERLFAEFGVESVSLRTVGIEAGQRNNSAAQYHFGSKDGLIAAIIEVRSADVDARRARLVAALRASAAPPTVPQLIDLLVVPLVETITASGERTWYLRFLANVMDHPMLDAPWRPRPDGADAAGPPDPPGLRYMHRELRRLLPGLPDAEFERRLRWQGMTAFRLLADYERQRATTDAAPPAEQVVADLNAMLTALLQAPHPAA